MKSLLPFIFLILLMFASSCGITHFQPHTDTYTGEVRVDSVMVRDSVYIDRIREIKTKADTVYITDVRTEYKYKYRDRIKIDTLVVTQTEVITEVKEVEKELTWWQRFRLNAFWYLAGAIALWVIWKIAKIRLHL